MEAEINYVESYLSDMNLPVCLVHNDFHNANIIYDEKTGMHFFSLLAKTGFIYL